MIVGSSLNDLNPPTLYGRDRSPMLFIIFQLSGTLTGSSVAIKAFRHEKVSTGIADLLSLVRYVL
jgi:hypothetical protein